MDIKLKTISLLVGIVLLVVSLFNVRRRKLSEDLALFWIILSLLMVLFAVRFDLIEKVSSLLGIINPNNLVFFLGLVFLVFITFYFSIKISGLEKRVIILAQENALLKKQKDVDTR
ncbi:MAG: DUF2304 domain-containing protein [Candidatus Omnitrophica bacterium]|nr:DUF2304 domain-containing protein [Candidatus Omnitrophota bacterium]